MTKRNILLGLAALFAVLSFVLRGIVAGMRFSGTLCLCAAAVMLLYVLLDVLAARSRAARWCSRILTALLICGFSFFIVLEALILRDATQEPTGEPQCVLVLGAGVNGTVPSLTLRTRLDAALAYIADKPDLPIIVSGGQGAGEDITEAKCMADWLIARGVDESRIWREEESTSTRENFEFSYALMREHGLDTSGNIALVTSDFHLHRAKRYGVNNIIGVPASLPEQFPYTVLQLNYYVREAFALGKTLVLGG